VRQAPECFLIAKRRRSSSASGACELVVAARRPRLPRSWPLLPRAGQTTCSDFARSLLGVCSEFARNLLGICSECARKASEHATKASCHLLFLLYRPLDEVAVIETLVHDNEGVALDVAMVASDARMEAIDEVGVGDPSPHKGLACSLALQMLEIEAAGLGLGAA